MEVRTPRDSLSFWLIFHSQVAGGAVSRIDPDSVGLNPAWRTAISHVIAVGVWPDGTNVKGINEVRAALKGDLKILASIAGDAAYFNEVGHFVSIKKD